MIYRGMDNNSMSTKNAETIKVQYEKSSIAIVAIVFPLSFIAEVIIASVISKIIPKPVASYINVVLMFAALIIATIICRAHIKKDIRNYDENVKQIISQGKQVEGRVIDYSFLQRLSDPSRILTVEFKNPFTGEMQKYQTPAVRNSLHIKKNNLPIKAIVYVHGDMVYVDAIIKPESPVGHSGE